MPPSPPESPAEPSPSAGGDPWDELRAEIDGVAMERHARELRFRRFSRPGVYTAAALYALALMLPCVSGVDSMQGETIWGIQALYLGAASFVTVPTSAAPHGDLLGALVILVIGYFPWWANVVGAVGLFKLWHSRFSAAAVLSGVSVGIGLLAVISVELGRGDLLPGFYVWIASFAAIGVAGYLALRSEPHPGSGPAIRED